MKIRSKLFLSFSVIVGIVIVVGYLPVSSIWSVSSSFDHLRNESLPDVALRGQIESVANNMVIEVQQIVIDSITVQGQSDDEVQLNAHLYKYENHKETIYSLLEEQAKITDEPEATLQLEEAINDLVEESDDVILAVRGGVSQDIIREQLDELDSAEGQFETLVTALLTSEINEIEEQSDQVAASIQTINNAIIAFAVIIIAAIVAISVYVSGSISKPLRKLEDVASQIAHGRFDGTVEVKGDEEVAQLATSISTMKDEIKDYNESLETKIEERTYELEQSNLRLKMKETELEKVNQELLQNQEKLIAAHKKVVEIDRLKDEFTSMVSHELKTPLVPIKGYVEMLAKTTILGELNDKQKNAAQLILKNVVKLEVLVRDILDAFNLEMGKMRIKKTDVEVPSFVNQLIADLKPLTVEKEIDLRAEIKSSDKIFCDPIRIGQVISNLIKNSVDFVGKKGKITVKVEDGNGRGLLFSVEDNGIGIPADKVDHMFQKFYQTDTSATRKHGGTGLGLAICRGIVEAHKGQIWVDRYYTGGARIQFTLPREVVVTN